MQHSVERSPQVLAPAPESDVALASSSEVADPIGNQQRLSDAGMQPGADPRDYGLSGSFAGLILDCLDIDAARELARDHLDNPAVVQWVEENEAFPHQVELESSLGQDFSDVQLVHDAGALDELGAEAATDGRTLNLAPGADAETVAHELVHVTQARTHGAGGAGEVSRTDDAAEVEAERLAAQAVSGQQARPSQPLSAATMRSAELDEDGEAKDKPGALSSLEKGAEIYFGSEDEGTPFARELMEWYLLGLGRPFVRDGDADWERFMLGRPQIDSAMDWWFESRTFEAGAGHQSEKGSIHETLGTHVALNTPNSMLFTLNGCHSIEITGATLPTWTGDDMMLSFFPLEMVWHDRGDMHPGTVTTTEDGKEYDDEDFSGVGFDYDIEIHFSIPEPSTWLFLGDSADVMPVSGW